MNDYDYFSSDFKLGILGGGQLGKMMTYTTRKWDIHTVIMDNNHAAPARQSCDNFILGDITDSSSVEKLGREVDVLTIEIENVSVEAMETLEKDGCKVYPSSKTLNLIKNKSTQKDFYLNHDIPTAEYLNLPTPSRPANWEYPFIWKAAEGGYDGKGVKVIHDEDDLEDLPKRSCLVEKMIDFRMELSVIVARSASGERKAYPVVEMDFHPEANQVEYVICPARIEKAIAEKAQALALSVSEAMEHIGLLAVEMFLTKTGEILVNEVAPRPHNSGHYSLEGSVTDQFEQHIRAILDMPLGDTAIMRPTVMVNLVGAEGHEGNVHYEGIGEILKMSGVTPHLYGKRLTRPFRKMGHVTITADTVEEALAKAKKVKETIRCISTGK